VTGFSFSQQASKHGHDDDIGIDDDDRDGVMRDSDESSAVGDMVISRERSGGLEMD
jgi:hypothetical protein